MPHDAPGNVRELANAMERPLRVRQGPDSRPSHYSFRFQGDELMDGKTQEGVVRVRSERVLRETLRHMARAVRSLDIDLSTRYTKLGWAGFLFFFKKKTAY